MTEKKFWDRIRSVWPGHAVRVEASEGGVDPGFPDAILSVGGHGGYVELKVWPEPLRETQLPWHIDAIQRGATAEVWAYIEQSDEVWCGTAEQYQDLLFELEEGPYQAHLPQGKLPKGVLLRVQVARFVKILLSKSPVV